MKVSSIRSSNNLIRKSHAWLVSFQVAVGIIVSITTVYISWKTHDLTERTQETTAKLKEIEQQLAENKFGFERVRDVYDRAEKYLSSTTQDESRGRVLVVLIGSLPDEKLRTQLLAVVTEKAQLPVVAAKAASLGVSAKAIAAATASGELATSSPPSLPSTGLRMPRSRFSGALSLGRNPGSYEGTVLEEFRFVDSSNRTWTVPKGFVFTGGSIPRVTWSLLGSPLDGRASLAAVLHQYYYTVKTVPREFVDRMFYEALVEAGLDKVAAELIYRSATTFGGAAWDAKP
jgi:Protein of unknown function (DUF1353)